MLKPLLITMVICFLLKVPVCYSLGIASVAGIVLGDMGSLAITIPQRMAAGINSFPLLAIPFFMLAGSIMEGGGVSKRIIAFADGLIGHIRGGLGCVTVLASAIFAAISGSTPATAAAIGSIIIPEMNDRGYPRDYSAAITACAACLGVIIPPSITLVCYGTVTSVSIGKLLIGGILPGVTLAAILIATNVILSSKKNYPTSPKASLKGLWKLFREAFWALLMPTIILGSIMTGICTPTESAIVSVVYGLFVGAFIYKELTWKGLGELLLKAALNSSTVMILIACASPIGWLMTTNGVPAMLKALILSITNSYYGIWIVVLLMLTVLGMFMEGSAIIFLVLPMIAPIMRDIGADMVHFGVIFTIVISIGMATPPVGISLFTTSSISGVSVSDMSKKAIPFILVMTLAAIAFIFIPPLVTWLPDLMIK